MTQRQINLGVTKHGMEECKKYNYFADGEAFLARISTFKKGEYIGFKVMVKLCEEIIKAQKIDWMTAEDLATINYSKVKCYLRGLTISHYDHFYYSDTLDLDNLSIR